MALRPLTEADLGMILEWRNAPEVRRHMYSKHEITMEEHREWFRRMQGDRESRWFVYANEGRAEGVVYFTQYRPDSGTSFWGFYTAPGTPAGTGTRLGLDALSEAFGPLRLHKLNSEVLATNERSIRFHEKLGFQLEGRFRDFHHDGERYVDVVRVGILSSEWEERRKSIERTVAEMAQDSTRAAPGNGGDAMRCVFASCKPWHREFFDHLRREGGVQWAWASDPEGLLEAVQSLRPRYVFFLHWNWRVPSEVWSQYECVCFHMTDVPYGRGGSPLQNLISAGHTKTRLSALRMVEAMDAGPVYAKRPLTLSGRAEEIYLRAGELSVELIRWIVANEPEPAPQHGEPTLFKRRKPEQSALPSQGLLRELYDHIRMLDAPTYPHAFLDHGEFRIEFSHATLGEDELGAKVTVRERRNTQENIP